MNEFDKHFDLAKCNKLHRDLVRDEVNGMSLYDLLERINNGMASGARCVIEAVTYRPYSCRSLSCRECIAQWLNKEATELPKEVDYIYESMPSGRT
jgi:hypothetical protein